MCICKTAVVQISFCALNQIRNCKQARSKQEYVFIYLCLVQQQEIVNESSFRDYEHEDNNNKT